MQIIIIILLTLILIFVMISGLIIYNQSKKIQQPAVDIASLKQTIDFSKETLKTQVETLAKQLDEFKNSWNGSDKEKSEKLVNLIANINNFQNSLNKKENDYKRDADDIKNKVINVITDLTKLKESSNILGKINDNVQNLQEVFVNTKKRGNVGEYVLEKILTNMLGANPKVWERQYKTNDGKIIDVYVKTANDREGIAIDSKFSLENYKKYLEAEDPKIKEEHKKVFRSDIRKRIDESAKYINSKNKISSVIMFIPSEEIFTFIYANFFDDIVEYAFKKHVWITSPTTLSAILFTIESHMKEIAFNHNIEKIKEELLKIKKDFEHWVERWNDVKNGFKNTNKAIEKIDITHNKLAGHYQKILEMPKEVKEDE